MCLVYGSLGGMRNQLLKTGGFTIRLFCGIMRLVTCPILSFLNGLLNIDWYVCYDLYSLFV